MKILLDLEKTYLETLMFFDLSEDKLSLTYGVGKWNIKQILHHIVDAETVLYERIKRTIAKPNQTIQAFDQEAWSKGLDYENMPLSLSKDIYIGIRKSIIYLATNYYDSHGHHEYTHSETMTRTVKQEFDKVASHNAQHLSQIQLALSNG